MWPPPIRDRWWFASDELDNQVAGDVQCLPESRTLVGHREQTIVQQIAKTTVPSMTATAPTVSRRTVVGVSRARHHVRTRTAARGHHRERGPKTQRHAVQPLCEPTYRTTPLSRTERRASRDRTGREIWVPSPPTRRAWRARRRRSRRSGALFLPPAPRARGPAPSPYYYYCVAPAPPFHNVLTQCRRGQGCLVVVGSDMARVKCRARCIGVGSGGRAVAWGACHHEHGMTRKPSLTRSRTQRARMATPVDLRWQLTGCHGCLRVARYRAELGFAMSNPRVE
jgi:hypothetical protein